MDFLEIAERLAAAVAIGFLIGVERGWKQREQAESTRVAGLRTYTLIGLMGGAAGLLAQEVGEFAYAALTLGFAGAWTYYKAREIDQENDYSITGLVAGLLVYLLGTLAMVGDIQIATGAGVLLALVLAFKRATHSWVRKLSWEELRSALLILAATLIALPLLPDRALDPWGAFNPRQLWLLTILLAGASFAGYVALRLFGPRRGLFIGGLAAAAVSSTAMTLDLARRTRAREAPTRLATAVAAAGNAVMIGRVFIFLAIFGQPALVMAGPPLLAAALLSAGLSVAFAWRAKPETPDSTFQKLGNPLDLRFVLQVGAVLAAIIALARLAQHFFGGAGLLALAATAGLVDVDAVTLAVASMVRDGTSAELGAAAVLLAVGVDTVSKAGLALIFGRARFAVPYAVASAAALVAGAAALGAVMRFAG
ncbi:hypothetical protein DDZ18_02480 [Marinicauda salina]|uniref:Uncharacterized protein n=1 Tax=Marinicauda salina TaxID=2135793 RepID=A0A2U2BWU5_9PROT|nr:DUF4010 domain-containing protein [Marinicauda salina]PWE18491.1 hypothetical protein DDZ18_02480 [Marinicauda salina]